MIKFSKYLPLVNLSLKSWFSQAAVHRCFSKYVFLKISQYSQESTGPCRPSFTFFSAESGIYCRQSHPFLLQLLWKHKLKVRSSHWNSSVKKGVLKNFASFSGKQLCWSLFLKELQTFRPAALLKRDSNIDVFLWNLQNF